MGMRSLFDARENNAGDMMSCKTVFISDDLIISWPEWFVEKYKGMIHFQKNKQGLISSNFKIKSFPDFEKQLAEDVQEVIFTQPKLRGTFFNIIFLQNCGGVVKATITTEKIEFLMADQAAWETIGFEQIHGKCFRHE